MKATADLQIIPLGDGVSVRRQVSDAVNYLKQQDFMVISHAAGTNIEGELHDILQAVEAIHQMLHEQGDVRLLSYLKLETRTDKTPTLDAKKL